MDPNVCLAEIRSLVTDFQNTDYLRLAELVDALDDWLSNGGFKPTDWEVGYV